MQDVEAVMAQSISQAWPLIFCAEFTRNNASMQMTLAQMDLNMHLKDADIVDHLTMTTLGEGAFLPNLWEFAFGRWGYHGSHGSGS